MNKENKRKIGNEMEDIAVSFLMGHKVKILDRNFYSSHGEIDIIASDGDFLCFVEVKYRSKDIFGEPQDAVNLRKRRSICRTADYYRYKNHYSEYTPQRFDVVAISSDGIEWIKNAFEYT